MSAARSRSLSSLGAALLLNAKLVRFKGLFRTIYFAPFVTTLVAVAIVWRYLYHPRYGLLNYALGKFGIGPIDWLGDPHWAMPAIILMAVWKNFGYNMLIFIAGLQSIPEELYEAAAIDGAGPLAAVLQQSRCRCSAPTLVFVGVVTMIGYFQLFAEPYVMTQGGPLRSTTSVVLLMYEEGFRWWRMGFAAAIAFVLFLVILRRHAGAVRGFRRSAHERRRDARRRSWRHALPDRRSIAAAHRRGDRARRRCSGWSPLRSCRPGEASTFPPPLACRRTSTLRALPRRCSRA